MTDGLSKREGYGEVRHIADMGRGEVARTQCRERNTRGIDEVVRVRERTPKITQENVHYALL